MMSKHTILIKDIEKAFAKVGVQAMRKKTRLLWCRQGDTVLDQGLSDRQEHTVILDRDKSYVANVSGLWNEIGT